MYQDIDQLEAELRLNQVSAQDIVSTTRAAGLPFRWHPLGFIVCTLLVSGAYKARLHIWPVDENRGQGAYCQIHDHIFDFSSWVLSGAVENIEYERSERGQQYALYSAEYEGETSVLKKTNETIVLTQRRTALYAAGANYKIQTGVLHETRRAGLNLAMTVLITRDIGHHAPIVAGPVTGPDQYRFVRSVLTEKEIEKVLDGM